MTQPPTHPSDPAAMTLALDHRCRTCGRGPGEDCLTVAGAHLPQPHHGRRRAAVLAAQSTARQEPR